MATSSGRLLGPPLARVDIDAALPPADAAPRAPPPADAANAEEVYPIHLPAFESPCLALFLVDSETPSHHLRQILDAAWELDPVTTLKLICHLRGVRGGGKGDREGFYTAALWLHENHPKTLAANLSAFAEFGYLKDFLEILYRLVQGADARKVSKEAGLKRKQARALTRLGVSVSGSGSRKRARSPDTACSEAVPLEPSVAAQVPDDQVMKDADSQPGASEMDVDQNQMRQDADQQLEASKVKVDSMAPPAAEKKVSKEAGLTLTRLGVSGSRKRARSPDTEGIPVEPSVGGQVPVDQLMKDADPQPEATEMDVDQNQMRQEQDADQQLEASEVMATPVAQKMAPSNKALRAAAKARLASQKHATDTSYQHLFDSVVKFFADRLMSDLKYHHAGQLSKIGLAAKWCPGVASSFDQALLICEPIACHIFPRQQFEEPEKKITEEQHKYLALRRFRREVLVPLRADLKLPELYMTSSRWSELPYERVAAQAMKQYTDIFKKRDPIRFSEFLEEKEKREKASRNLTVTLPSKLEAGPLLPHHLVTLLDSSNARTKKLAQETWEKMVAECRREGKLTDSVVVCDLGGCNVTTKRKVCVALGILISQLNLTLSQWVFPFSTTPKPQSLPGSYEEKLNRLGHKDNLPAFCTRCIDLNYIFDVILWTAKNHHLKPEHMVKTIFIITNKEFEQASVRPWRPDYVLICDAYNTAGYGDVVPQVVYWNIDGPRSAALTSTKDGVMYLSGFSDELMKLFLELGGVVEPEDEMNAAIAGKDYKRLVVID